MFFFIVSEEERRLSRGGIGNVYVDHDKAGGEGALHKTECHRDDAGMMKMEMGMGYGYGYGYGWDGSKSSQGVKVQ